MDVEYDQVRQHEEQRHDPDGDDDDSRSGRRAAELERVADGVPALDGYDGERENGHRHRHALQATEEVMVALRIWWLNGRVDG